MSKASSVAAIDVTSIRFDAGEWQAAEKYLGFSRMSGYNRRLRSKRAKIEYICLTLSASDAKPCSDRSTAWCWMHGPMRPASSGISQSLATSWPQFVAPILVRFRWVVDVFLNHERSTGGPPPDLLRPNPWASHHLPCSQRLPTGRWHLSGLPSALLGCCAPVRARILTT